jgi:hydroxymethylglutaryl-CoA lyase
MATHRPVLTPWVFHHGYSKQEVQVRRPQREIGTGVPGRVTIYEVGPRDGLQNEKSLVPVQVKAEFIRRLVGAGLDTVETTSFVPPGWVPQLADSGALLDLLGPVGRGPNRPVLVPNEKGLDAALAQGAEAVAIFGSATETFARKNLNRSVQESIAMFAPVVERARGQGLWVRAYVSMCFGDPWEGDVPIDQVVGVARQMMDLGCDQLSLGDTIGTGTTGHVHRLLDALDSKGIGAGSIGVHFHDTYGQALANTLAALAHGVTVVDASAGGLGGCPYAKSATGNLATEDLVWALDGLGIETGVDLEALVDTSVWMAAHLGRPSPSRVVRALTGGSGSQSRAHEGAADGG